MYQLWHVDNKQLIKIRDVVFHEHVLWHPTLVRDKLALGWEFTGDATSADNSEFDTIDSDDIETLYPVIGDLKSNDKTDCTDAVLQLSEKLIEPSIPNSFDATMKSKEADQWSCACTTEHNAMISNDVYDWVCLEEVDKNTRILPSKWLFIIKRRIDSSIEKYKARIVAVGHIQRKGIDFKETYAPVAKFASLRILLTLAALNDWSCEQGDIVTAFLHGDLEETIYMRSQKGIFPKLGNNILYRGKQCVYNGMLIPENLKPNIVWRLNKSLYGLKQSPRCFYNRLDAVLKSKDYIRVHADYGVWTKRQNEREVILIVHVDDMLVLGTKIGIEELKMLLNASFEMKWMGPLQDSLFVGVRIRCTDVFLLSQERYANAIVFRFELNDANECFTPVDPKEDCNPRQEDIPLNDIERQTYQAALGSLIYLMLGTRPDLAFPINKLAQYSSTPTMRHWNGVKRIIQFVKKTACFELVLGKRSIKTGGLVGYFDAAYMDDSKDRHSTMGYIFFYCHSAISWAWKKQHTVPLSTTEAEYLAGTEATKESIWITAFLEDIGEKVLGPVKLLVDN